MVRASAVVACLVAVVAQASAFMFAAPGTVVGAAASIRAHQGAAVSGFTGYSPVTERETSADRSTLRMMVCSMIDLTVEICIIPPYRAEGTHQTSE